MRVVSAGVVCAACVLAAGALTGCQDDGPAADPTGPVAAADAQDSPQNLIVEILRLREQGHPDQAAQYFISRDAYPDLNDLKDLTEVDPSTLCSSNAQSGSCTGHSHSSRSHAYAYYLNGDTCPKTTSQEVQKEGVTDNGRPFKAGDRLVEAEVDSAHPTEDGERGCGFNMSQIGGKWWIAGG